MVRTFKQFLAEELKLEPGTQKGSNPGGIHKDTETGKKYYVKYYKNGDQAKSEALTGKIYHAMGIHTIKPEYKHINGKHAIATEWNPNLEKMEPSEYKKLSPDQHKQLGKMYHAAVLTKNWDIVGLEHDNILRDKKTGNLHAIDHGGSFNFRAQGGHKDYGPDIAEHQSLRSKDLPSGQVFNHTFKTHPEAEKEGADAVKKLDMDKVHHLFKTSGLKNWEELHRNFVDRRDKLLSKYK